MTAEDIAKNAELQEEFLKPEPKINGITMRPVDYGSKDLLRRAIAFLPIAQDVAIPQNETPEQTVAREKQQIRNRTDLGLSYLHFFLFIQGAPLDLVIDCLDDSRAFRHAVARFMIGWNEEEVLKGARWQSKMLHLEKLTQFEIVPKKSSGSDNEEIPPPNA